jgi:predicted acyltransferase (DUF342 family)
MVFIKLNRGSKLRQIKKQLAATLLCSTFALAAHAGGINFDGAYDAENESKISGCALENIGTSFEYSCTSFNSENLKSDIYISSGVTVLMDSGNLEALTAIFGATAKLSGNLNSVTTVVLGAGAGIEGNVDAGTTVALGDGATVIGYIDAKSTVALGANATVIGDVTAATTIAVGANGRVFGNVNAASTFALGADGIVYGNVVAGTTVALGAASHVYKKVDFGTGTGTVVINSDNGEVTKNEVNVLDIDNVAQFPRTGGDVTAETTVAMGAASSVAGNVISNTSTVTLGVNASIKGTTESLIGAVTLGEGAYTCGTIEAVTATLGAGSFVKGNLEATTQTLAAGAFVTQNLDGTDGTSGTSGTSGYSRKPAVTITLGAKACFGVGYYLTPTITFGAHSGLCKPIPSIQSEPTSENPKYCPADV